MIDLVGERLFPVNLETKCKKIEEILTGVETTHGERDQLFASILNHLLKAEDTQKPLKKEKTTPQGASSESQELQQGAKKVLKESEKFKEEGRGVRKKKVDFEKRNFELKISNGKSFQNIKKAEIKHNRFSIKLKFDNEKTEKEGEEKILSQNNVKQRKGFHSEKVLSRSEGKNNKPEIIDISSDQSEKITQKKIKTENEKTFLSRKDENGERAQKRVNVKGFDSGKRENLFHFRVSGESYTGNPADIKGKRTSDENVWNNPRGFQLQFARYESTGVRPPMLRPDYVFYKNGDEIYNDIVRQFSITLSKGGGEARITLNPEILGNLRMNLKLNNHEVNAFFIVDNPLVKELLLSRVDMLQQSLFQQGMNLGSFQVEVKDQGFKNATDEEPENNNIFKDRGRLKEIIQMGQMDVEYSTLPWISTIVNIYV